MTQILIANGADISLAERLYLEEMQAFRTTPTFLELLDWSWPGREEIIGALKAQIRAALGETEDY